MYFLFFCIIIIIFPQKVLGKYSNISQYISLQYAIRHTSVLLQHYSTCTDEWRPTASTLCLLSLPCKRAGGKSQLRSKRSSNEPFLENFLTTGSYFELYMYRVMGWRRRKKMNKSESLLFQVCHFKKVTTHCYYYCRLGQAL